MEPATSRRTNKCVVCSAPARDRCGGCKGVYYCGREHQRKDWPSHKAHCGTKEAAASADSDLFDCARCGAPGVTSIGALCQVPHPRHLLHDAGATYSNGVCQAFFRCSACGQRVTRTSPTRHPDEGTVEPALCYMGPHCHSMHDDEDQRRVLRDALYLTPDAKLQHALNNIPKTHPDVRILSVNAPGFFEDKFGLHLSVRMPHLQELTLWDVKFTSIKLTPELTPCLRSLAMQNISDCDFDVTVPTLERFVMNHHESDGEWICNMLSNAPALRFFQTYKLWVPELVFASNVLEEVIVHRSDCMATVRLYAPNLQLLQLSACYSLESVVLETSHPTLSALLPPRHKPSSFSFRSENSLFSEECKAYLSRHPRVRQVGPMGLQEDDE